MSTPACRPKGSPPLSAERAARSSLPDVFVPEIGLGGDELGHQRHTVGVVSVDEFDAIMREEALVPRLNALDQACEARGIMGLGGGEGESVMPLARPPDAVMRALRADVKRREAESIRAKLAEAEEQAAEARQRLNDKSKQAREMAQGLRAGAADLQGVHKSSMEWAARAPTFPAGAGAGPAAPPTTA